MRMPSNVAVRVSARSLRPRSRILDLLFSLAARGSFAKLKTLSVMAPFVANSTAGACDFGSESSDQGSGVPLSLSRAPITASGARGEGR